ncbi:cytochrome P450 [Aspergillus bertholletiae]|uniref:Cytochrome P450 n=1 Tax=Aspergillus bertholletiae TaxID=1226010 RepID=A0A5N7AP19_9EURO|nr:cytochrome P450 [Aspergillus bertholletiae]
MENRILTSQNPAIIAGYTISLLLIAWLSRCVYYGLFHPLCHVPGPRLAALSRWWLFFKEMQGKPHEVILDLHRTYGSLVRIAPDEVSVNGHQAYLEIYGQNSKFLKAPYYYNAFKSHTHNLFTMSDKEDHSSERRLYSHAFSRANILKYENMICDKVIRLMNQMSDSVQRGEPIPLSPACRSLTLGTISEWAFGNPMRLSDDKTFESSLYHTFDTVTPVSIFFQHFPTMRRLQRWLGALRFPFLLNPIGDMEKCVKEGLEKEKMAKQSDLDLRNTMFGNVITKAEQKGTPIEDTQMISEGVLMIFAGTDTTAATLSNGLYSLLKRPDLYTRLQQELLTVMPTLESRPTVMQLESLPLLDACIKEGLRHVCPVRGRLPRVVPPEGWKFGNLYLPPGTLVASTPLYECRNEEAFPKPTEYLPERWLVKDRSNLLAHFQPFSTGPRQCIGQNLSMIEQFLAIAHFVRRFTPIHVIGPDPDLKEFSTLWFKSPLNVELRLEES